MSLRYLDADEVTLPSRSPQFVKEGHCQWCNGLLTGKQRFYCSEECTFAFYNYWCSRPAYVRATFIQDNFTCKECGYHEMLETHPWLPAMYNLECDHITPLARGGKPEMGNLQTLCKTCNHKKGICVPGESLQDLPQVIPLRDKSSCPTCRARGYLVLPWEPPAYFDPLMIKVRCHNCGEDSYIGPKPINRSNRGAKQCQ